MDEFDYVIVGGGSAGCVLASRLSEDPSVSVALLEAGPPDSSVLIRVPAGIAAIARARTASEGFDTVPQPGLKGRRGWQPRGRTLGGSSSINAMCYVRGHPSDYDGWAAAGNPGWGWTDVLPYFLRAERNERGASAWHGGNGPLNVADVLEPNPFSHRFVEAAEAAGIPRNDDFNGPSQEGAGFYQVTQKGGERFSAARAYLEPARGRPNLAVLTGASVERVGLEGGAATHVVARVGGQARTLRARREVLLCAGAFHSPAILMRSGIGPGALLRERGVAVVHDLPGVGENLHDHPDVILVANAPGAYDLFGQSPRGAWRLLQGVRQWRAERRGMLTTNFAEAGAFVRTDPSEPIPDLQLHFVIAKLVDHGRKAVPGHGFSVHACVLRPRSRGRVRIAGPDPSAAPEIDPNFLADPDDAARLVRGVRLVRRIIGQPSLARYGTESKTSAAMCTDDEIEDWVRRTADTIYHPVGTCRMGPGPEAVVDARLRVHGVRRLRVVDASVMPAIVGGNTNAPTIMIGEKASDMVREDARRSVDAVAEAG
ncbi:MAG TPA: GMC family oxidoreductase N-terminal domain-containing protein [Burkholderiaceae bacterium]|nr:GMC family oxidoreductase N-terminal domain-containing protein [Burkholderiaceae bacterium]